MDFAEMARYYAGLETILESMEPSSSRPLAGDSNSIGSPMAGGGSAAEWGWDGLERRYQALVRDKNNDLILARSALAQKDEELAALKRIHQEQRIRLELRSEMEQKISEKLEEAEIQLQLRIEDWERTKSQLENKLEGMEKEMRALEGELKESNGRLESGKRNLVALIKEKMPEFNPDGSATESCCERKLARLELERKIRNAKEKTQRLKAERLKAKELILSFRHELNNFLFDEDEARSLKLEEAEGGRKMETKPLVEAPAQIGEESPSPSWSSATNPMMFAMESSASAASSVVKGKGRGGEEGEDENGDPPPPPSAQHHSPRILAFNVARYLKERAAKVKAAVDADLALLEAIDIGGTGNAGLSSSSNSNSPN